MPYLTGFRIIYLSASFFLAYSFLTDHYFPRDHFYPIDSLPLVYFMRESFIFSPSVNESRQGSRPNEKLAF